MNKIISSALIVGSLSASLFADCKVLNFGEINQNPAYAGTIRTASRFTSGHSAGVDSDS